MSFVLFLLLNAALFLRPAEIVPSLLDMPIYEVLILACLATSVPQVIRQIDPRSLIETPISLCVVGILGSVILSHLSHFATNSAITSGVQFTKVLLYYLLVVGVLDSIRRLRFFFLWLIGLILILTALALLQYHGVVDIPALGSYAERQHDEIDPQTGEPAILLRLCSSGIYGNPNDLARILGIGILLCICALRNQREGSFRAIHAAPILVLGYALYLTHSRGGLLAFLGGLGVLFVDRFGTKKSIFIGAVLLPIVLVTFTGRQLNLSANEGTGQQRIQLWEEGFSLFLHSPLFGIGMDNYAEEVGLAAHNSFIQCHTELGFIGGTFYFSAFFISLHSLHLMGKQALSSVDSELERLRVCLLAITVSTVIGMLTSTRSYSNPTYLIVGFNVAYFRVVSKQFGLPVDSLSGKLVARSVLCSAGFLLLLYIYVQLMVRHGSGLGH